MDIDQLILEAVEERVRDASPLPNSRQRLLTRARKPRAFKRALWKSHKRQRIPRPWLMPHYAHELYPAQAYHYRSLSVIVSQSTCQLLVLML
jgi:hypothetical protein